MTVSHPRLFRPSLLLPALVLLAAALPLAAQVPADSVLRGFEPTGDYLLYLDGAEVSAEIYQSQRAAAFLVMSSKLASPVLISPRSGAVESVNLMKVAKRDDGSIDLLADATLAPLGQFRIDEEDVVFAVDGKEARLKPRPPLVGEQEASALREYSPYYVRAAESFQPDAELVSALKQQNRSVRVKVFFGSWCSVCKRYVPHVLKLEEELDGSIDFDYFGLARPPEGWEAPEVQRMGVTGVPTGIVFVDGKEAGRITGNSWAQLENILDRIIENAPTGAR
jgi:thiol-disulfide isomerase/thioredoxin